MLPMLLAEAANGQFGNLMAQSRMLEQLIGEQIYVPLQLSVMCAEDAPWMRVDPADVGTILGMEFVEYTLAQCAVWPRGAMPQDFHDAVQSDLPVLLLSGELDPVTPPRYAEDVQRTLPNSRHFVFRGQGHSVMGVGCGPRLVAEFIAAADAKALDGDCLDQLQYSPPFGGSYGWDP
jgi:pimeloyl-ACP methyl ester carboxylesterase